MICNKIGIFRQNDYLFVVCQGPILYNISLTTKNSEIAVNKVFWTKRTYHIYNVFNSFIGGYYDSENDSLILGTNNAQIYIFKNRGKLDKKFNDRFSSFRKQQFNSNGKLEKGNLLYYDVDRNCIIYIGLKSVMKVSLEKEKESDDYRMSDDKFANIYDIKVVSSRVSVVIFRF